MAVASASTTSSASLVATPCTVLGVHWVGGASAGSVVLKDGGSGGTVKVTIPTPASAAAAGFVPIPGGGINFGTDVYCTLTQATGCTVVYL